MANDHRIEIPPCLTLKHYDAEVGNSDDTETDVELDYDAGSSPRRTRSFQAGQRSETQVEAAPCGPRPQQDRKRDRQRSSEVKLTINLCLLKCEQLVPPGPRQPIFCETKKIFSPQLTWFETFVSTFPAKRCFCEVFVSRLFVTDENLNEENYWRVINMHRKEILSRRILNVV